MTTSVDTLAQDPNVQDIVERFFCGSCTYAPTSTFVQCSSLPLVTDQSPESTVDDPASKARFALFLLCRDAPWTTHSCFSVSSMRLCLEIAKVTGLRISNAVLVFDLETTGLAPTSRIFQYCFQDFDTQEVVASCFLRGGYNDSISMSQDFVQAVGKSHPQAIRELNLVLRLFADPVIVSYSPTGIDNRWLKNNGVQWQWLEANAYWPVMKAMKKRGFIGKFQLGTVAQHLEQKGLLNTAQPLRFHDARDDTLALILVLRALSLNPRQFKVVREETTQRALGKVIRSPST